jgi:hypothetical protein
LAAGAATVAGVGRGVIWNDVASSILVRLDEIDAALNELLPLTKAIASRKKSVHGIGHNNPPPDLGVTESDLDEVATAVIVVREQLQNPDQISASPLRLSEIVLQRVGALSEWVATLGKVAIEECVKAAAAQAGKRTVDAIYYIKLFAAFSVACGAAAALIHAIPI